MAVRLKALADPTRLRLFSLVASQPEQCAYDLTEPLGVSQPTVSHHLKVLTEAGLLTRECSDRAECLSRPRGRRVLTPQTPPRSHHPRRWTYRS